MYFWLDGGFLILFVPGLLIMITCVILSIYGMGLSDKTYNIVMGLGVFLVVIGVIIANVLPYTIPYPVAPDNYIYKIDYNDKDYYVDSYELKDGSIQCDDYWYKGKHYDSMLIILDDDVKITER